MHSDRNIRVVEALDWKVWGRSGPGLELPGLHKEEEAVAAGKGRENKHKSKERWRGRTRKKEVGKQEEKEGMEKGRNTLNSDWNIRGSNAPGLEHLGGGCPGLEHPGKRGCIRGRTRRRQEAARRARTRARRVGEKQDFKNRFKIHRARYKHPGFCCSVCSMHNACLVLP